MRIISGKYKNIPLISPNIYRTHPMSERIRGAIFNILGDISGMSVLDAFGGTGALALESLSRGADSAYCVEIDKIAMSTIKQNIEKLGVEDQMTVVQANIKGWSGRNSDKQFDIVFCDPPYDAVLQSVIEKLSTHVLDHGFLVLSWPTSEPIPELPNMETLRHKTYGPATLVFYKKTG